MRQRDVAFRLVREPQSRVALQISRTSNLQRKFACDGTPIAGGECLECRKKLLQTKLATNQPDDFFEHAVDRAAEAVTSESVAAISLALVPAGNRALRQRSDDLTP